MGKKIRVGNEAVKMDRRVGKQEQRLDAYGRELPDPTPMAPPVGYKKQPSLKDQIRQMVVGERLKAEAAAAGKETFEEADDFEVGDDYDPRSPYEEVFEGVPVPNAGEELERAVYQAIMKAQAESAAPQQPKPPADPSDASRSSPAAEGGGEPAGGGGPPPVPPAAEPQGYRSFLRRGK